MNIEQAQLFANITKYIRTVPLVDYCSPPNGLLYGIKIGCWFFNAIQGGFIQYSEEYELSTKYGTGDSARRNGAALFGITYKEMGDIIHIKEGGASQTGETHYERGKELLEKYGYGHLLEKPLPNWQAMSQIPQAERERWECGECV